MQTHPAQSLNWVPVNRGALESFWVLAQRFMIRNVLSPYEFCHHFERPGIRRQSVAGRHVYRRLDLDRLAPFLGHSSESIRSSLPMAWEFGIRDSNLGPVKLCSQCAEQGFHSALFETGWLHICPIHNRPLIDRCPTCNKLLSHISWRRFGPAPGALACGHAWSGVSLRDAPVVDAANLRRLADWALRLRGSASEETWYAVALHGASSLRQEDRDFQELVDVVAAIAGIGKPAEMRNAFWLRHFRPARIRKTSAQSLRADWFDATLARLSRYLGSLSAMDWQDQIGHIRRPYETYRWLRDKTPQRFIDHLRGRICLLPLYGREPVKTPLEQRALNVVACALLQKHALSSSHPPYQAVSFADKVDRIRRYSGGPLGCLRVSRRDFSVYWAPNVLTPTDLSRPVDEAAGNIDRSRDDRRPD